MTLVHYGTPGERIGITNEFGNVGDAPVRIVSIRLESDLGNQAVFSARQPNPANVSICGEESYYGALNLDVGQSWTVGEIAEIPVTSSIGNHTVTVFIGWQYYTLYSFSLFPSSPPVSTWLWCDAPPLTFQTWILIQPNPRSQQTSNPESMTQFLKAFESSLESSVRAGLPFAFGIIMAFAVLVVLLLVRDWSRTHHDKKEGVEGFITNAIAVLLTQPTHGK